LSAFSCGSRDVSVNRELSLSIIHLNYLPDEKLMRVLEEERDKGQNDYPVRSVWNSILAGVVYEHRSVQSLRRELKRNGVEYGQWLFIER
jgi:hypothetical protein